MVQVQKCREGDLGIELQLKAEKDTTPHIEKSRFVPTIHFGEYDEALHWRSISDFNGVVHELHEGNH